MAFQDEEKTDEARGIFVFRVNPELTYDLFIDAKGHVAKQFHWRAPSDSKPTVITLDKRSSLTVRVVDEQGRSVEDGWVNAWGPPRTTPLWGARMGITG